MNSSVGAAATPPDLYALIGVASTADSAEIRRAFGEKVKGAMDDLPRFEALNAAYEILRDSEKRAAYDRQHAKSGLAPQSNAGENTRMSETGVMNDSTMAMPPSGATMLGGQTVAATPTIMGFGGDRTQAVTVLPCAICGTPGVLGEEYCIECGFMVGTAVGEEMVNRPLPRFVDSIGREFPLKLGENIIGREGADVILPDRTVSRRHAKVVVEESGVAWLEDFGSTNGTRLAGATVPPAKQTSLSDRAALQFGSVKLTIILPSGFARALLALPAPDPSTIKTPAAALPPPEAFASPEDSAARLIGPNGKVFPLASEKFTVGRRAGNSIVISDDAFVSGSHAEIVYGNGKFQIADLGSTNGTKLNGRKLLPNAPEALADGDELTVGQTAYIFREPGSAGS